MNVRARFGARVLTAALTAVGVALIAQPGGASAPPLTRPVGSIASSLHTLPVNVAEASMTQPLNQDSAAAKSCAYGARDNRTTGAVPADASQVQLIYFVPANVTVHNWDRATLCSDGTYVESQIGKAFHNMRRWMGTRPAGSDQGSRMHDHTLGALTRSQTCGSQTCTSYRVMFVKGAHNDSYYTNFGSGTDPANGGSCKGPFCAVAKEVHPRFNKSHVKYMVFADVRGPNTAGPGTVVGTAWINGNFGVVFHRATDENGDFVERWGCGDIGDAIPAHELIHEWGVQHVADSQVDDLMNATSSTSFTGKDQDGSSIHVTIWDDGANSYTDRVLSFPAYLHPTPGHALFTCAPIS